MPHTDYRDIMLSDIRGTFQVTQLKTSLEKLNEVFKKSFLRYLVGQLIDEISEEE